VEEIIALPKHSKSYLEREGAYETLLSSATEDDAWDAFLGQTEGGDLLQSSGWSRLKQINGWQVRRLIVKKDNRIVAGAQILLRPLPAFLGSIGYVPRGPVLSADKPELARFVLTKMQEVARHQRLQLLFIQPPRPYKSLDALLQNGYFRPTRAKIAPLSTLRVDLTADHDDILGQMRGGTRTNIRRSHRKGIVVREGTADDLEIFVKLHEASSERQGFSTASEEYFAHMWRVFAPTGRGALFISEYEGKAVSAFLVIGFGKIVWAKRFGWSGREGNRKPNEVLVWTAMQWAKSQGYHWFDQDGIKWEAAEALLNDQPLPESVKHSPSNFKLGFGGQPFLFPNACVYAYNPVLRYGYSSLFPKLARWSVTKKLINRMRLS
jgi:lipid II:glycine glycyltransferase (peptidoglycan interpeptide bridge formation enzyme)